MVIIFSCIELEEGRTAPRSSECNQQDREVRSESPRDECYTVCRTLVFEDNEDGLCVMITPGLDAGLSDGGLSDSVVIKLERVDGIPQ